MIPNFKRACFCKRWIKRHNILILVELNSIDALRISEPYFHLVSKCWFPIKHISRHIQPLITSFKSVLNFIFGNIEHLDYRVIKGIPVLRKILF